MLPVVVIVVLGLLPVHSSARSFRCGFSVNNVTVIGHCKNVSGPIISCSQELYDHVYRILRLYEGLQQIDRVHDIEVFISQCNKLKAECDDLDNFVKEALSQQSNLYSSTCISIDELEMWVQNVHKSLRLLTEFSYWGKYIYPSLGGLLLIFGMVGNIMIVIMYLIHKALQTKSNKIVLNLALADILVLVCSVPVMSIFPKMFSPKSVSLWDVVYLALCVIPVDVSIFLLVFLNFMRFLATIATPGSRSQELIENKKMINRVLVLVWLSVITIRILLVVFARYLNREITLPLNCLYFILVCPLPLILITVFSAASARVLTRNIPGEETPAILQETRRRRRGAKVLISFIFVFSLTHVPINILAIITFINESPPVYGPTAPYIMSLLTVLHSCLNPVGLFIGSSQFHNQLNEDWTTVKKNIKQWIANLVNTRQ